MNNRKQYSMNEDNQVNKNKEPLLISIIIPMLNEENTIKNVINNIPNHLKNELIIIDDGSQDDSVKMVKEIKRDIKLILNGKNLGYTASILKGLRAATGDICVTMDADGQHDPKEIQTVINPIIDGEADMVVGSRYLGECIYFVPLYTRIAEYLIGLCLRFLFRQRVYNNQSGFRAFNRKSLFFIDEIITSKFGFCTEVLFKAAYNKIRIKEVPITIGKRQFGVSYVNILEIFWPITLTILLFTLKKFKNILRKLIPKKLLERIYLIITKSIKNMDRI